MQVERIFWRLKFKILFLERTGTGFQDLVREIMQLRFPDEFVDIAPAGPEGDHKCDGFLTEQKRILQVYAPERWRKRTALAKINRDYAGAVEHWGDRFEIWTFTHNAINGVPPYVLSELQEISESTDSGHVCEHWGFAKLRDLTFELEDEQLAEFLGPAVSLATMLSVEVQDVIPMLKSIEDAPQSPIESVRPVPSDKLERNRLSEDAESLLLLGMRRTDQVNHYFSQLISRPLFRDELGTRFAFKYEEFRESGLAPDDIVTAFVTWLTGQSQSPKQTAAALAVVAYFFEECDIFEAPIDLAS